MLLNHYGANFNPDTDSVKIIKKIQHYLVDNRAIIMLECEIAFLDKEDLDLTPLADELYYFHDEKFDNWSLQTELKIVREKLLYHLQMEKI